MAEPPPGRDPDAQTARVVSLGLVGLLLAVLVAVAIFGPKAAYVAAAVITPIWMVGLVLLALESSDPDHARAFVTEDEEDKG